MASSSPGDPLAQLDESQASTVDRADEARSTEVDLSMMVAWVVLGANEKGWGVDALAAHMDRDKSYISRVLNAEKPLNLAFLLALPKDVQAFVAEQYVRHFGYLVVRPVSADFAVQNLVSGLIALLATPLTSKPQHPAKPRMAKAELKSRT